MPVNLVEVALLLSSLLIFTIPGYFWSFFFFKQCTTLERMTFGFVLTLGVLCCGLFVIDMLLGLPVTRTKLLVILGVYTVSGIFFFVYTVRQRGMPTVSFSFLKQPKMLLLCCILFFVGVLTFLPHLSSHYYLPFHVDEWIHWQYSKAVVEQGSTAFINPYTGSGIARSLEPGFHYMTASIKWVTGISFNTIVVFMPSLIMMVVSAIAFTIGERSEHSFGLEAAFLVALIPTTCRTLGPSFYVAVATGLLIVVFIIWLLQCKTLYSSLLVPFFIWCVFLIHPPTALAALIIVFIYGLMLLGEQAYKQSLLTLGLLTLPLGLVFFLASRWGYELQQVIDAFLLGNNYFVTYDLPQIWPSFEHLGIITWALCIVGAYFAFTKGRAVVRTLTLSAIAFLALIGLYDKLGYGVPIMYERSFMYLFLMVTLLAGFGLAELRRFVTSHSSRFIPKRYNKWLRHHGLVIPALVFLILFATAVPAHLAIPYYQMISEDEYATFTWIDEHIDDYRNETHHYEKAAVNPFYASPFSTVTGLSIVSSSMHPIYEYSLHQEVESFLSAGCTDIAFLNHHGISVIYGSCTNANLTEIYPHVYLYPGFYNS